MLTKEELIAFEDDIKACYLNKEIRAPIHLRSGCEDALIEIFKDIEKDSYVFSTWASHHHALLHGIPKEKVKQRILDGLSISLCFPEYNFYASGIVGNLVGACLGAAISLKAQGKSNKCYLFLGDMAASLGITHEAIRYAKGHKLDNFFVIVEDNGVSVLTDTKRAWGLDDVNFYKNDPMVKSYSYFNGFPHSGVNVKVSF